MKLKRRLVMLVLTVTMILSTMIVAQAGGTESIHSRSAALHLYADIDFVDGSFLSRDEYFYQVCLAGSDLDKVPKKDINLYYVRIYNDEDELVGSLYPYYAKPYLYGSKCYGYSSHFAIYRMKCYDISTKEYAF